MQMKDIEKDPEYENLKGLFPDPILIDEIPLSCIILYDLVKEKTEQINKLKLHIGNKKREIERFKEQLANSEGKIKQIKDYKEEQKEEITKRFIRFIDLSQELLQSLIQIPDISLEDELIAKKLIMEHKNNVKEKLENMSMEGNNSFLQLQQHEIAMHNQINDLCQRLYQLAVKAMKQYEESRKQIIELSQNINKTKLIEEKKNEESQIKYVIYITEGLLN